MKGQNGFAAVVSIAILFGCATPKIQNLLSPLPQTAVSGKKRLSAMEKLFTPLPARVTLGWNNAASPFSTNWETGLEGTTNFRDWYEVASLPYTTQAVVTLSNRPPDREFFRAFNRIKLSSGAAGAALPERPDLAGYARRLPEHQRY